NAQAKRQLRDLDGSIAKMPTLIEGPKAQCKMRHGSGVKRNVDNRDSPPPDVISQPPFHRRVGNIAKCMVEEMRENIREHHEAACDAHLPDGNASQPGSRIGVA